MEVGGRERERQPGARLVAEEPHRLRHLEPLARARVSSACRAPNPITTISSPLEVAEEGRGADERVEVLRVPDVARVHDDERIVEAVLARPGVVPRLRRELLRVDPVRDHLDAAGGRALRLEAQLHRLADRDDAVGAPQVERDEPPQRAEHERLLEPLDALGDLGEDVLADHEERHAEAPRDEEPDVADHGGSVMQRTRSGRSPRSAVSTVSPR